MNIKRVFLIVLDSFGIGEAPDASDYNDQGSNTLASISISSNFNVTTLRNLGLFNIDGVTCKAGIDKPIAAHGIKHFFPQFSRREKLCVSRAFWEQDRFRRILVFIGTATPFPRVYSKRIVIWGSGML